MLGARVELGQTWRTGFKLKPPEEFKEIKVSKKRVLLIRKKKNVRIWRSFFSWTQENFVILRARENRTNL